MNWLEDTRLRSLPWRRLGTVVVPTVLLGLLVYLANPRAVLSVLWQARIEWYVLGGCFYLAGYLPTTLRWLALQRTQTDDSSLLVAFEVIMISYALNQFLPGNSGDLVRSKITAAYHDIGTHSEQFSLVVVERVADMATVLVLFGITTSYLGVVLLPDEVYLLVAGVGLAGLVVLFNVGWRLRRHTTRLPAWLADPVRTAVTAALTLSSRTLGYVAALSVLRWLFVAVSLSATGTALGISVSIPLAIAVVTGMGVMAIVPLTPGGIGAGEAAAVALLVTASIEYPTAVALAVLSRSFGFFWAAPLGLVLYLYRFTLSR